jgi:tetratricopeptide (TPR) repeat protein
MKQKTHKKEDKEAASILVAKGYKHHQAGKLRQAESFYRQSLQQNPSNPDTNNVFGLLCIQTGRFDDATKLIKRALSSQPGNPQSHYNLAIAYKELDHIDAAEKHFRKSISLAPGNFEALNSLGVILRNQGKPDESLKCLKAAIKLNPYYAQAHCNAGIAYQDLNETKQAESCFGQAANLTPDMVEAHIGLAECAIDQKRFAEALSHSRHALKADPESSQAHNTHGIALNKQGKTEHAIESFERAVEFSLTNSGALMNLAITLEQSGRLQEAAEFYKKAIKAKPDFSRAHYLLAHLKNHDSSDEEVSAAETLLKAPETDTTQRADLAFALACALENRQQYAESFKHLQEGHRLKKKTPGFDLNAEAHYFQSLAETFSAEFFTRHADQETPGQRTVFILGMPRSGTSLTEQILASHASVFGAGELSLLAGIGQKIAKNSDHPFPLACDDLDQASIHMYRQDYLQELKKRSPKAEIITDTNPMNFIYTGLIATLLPNALVINCVRDPMDNCLSIFKHLLADPHAYSHDLEDLGGYFMLYKNLMKHWHQVLPGRIYNLPYEKMVADSEIEIRKLLDFCALPFDENCLNFHTTSRVVRTPSASQVRQPLYSDTINLWKHYEQQLKPLQIILNPN